MQNPDRAAYISTTQKKSSQKTCNYKKDTLYKVNISKYRSTINLENASLHAQLCFSLSICNTKPPVFTDYSAFVSVDIISACGQPISCSVAPVLARVICPCFVVVTVTGTRLKLAGVRPPVARPV